MHGAGLEAVKPGFTGLQNRPRFLHYLPGGPTGGCLRDVTRLSPLSAIVIRLVVSGPVVTRAAAELTTRALIKSGTLARCEPHSFRLQVANDRTEWVRVGASRDCCLSRREGCHLPEHRVRRVTRLAESSTRAGSAAEAEDARRNDGNKWK